MKENNGTADQIVVQEIQSKLKVFLFKASIKYLKICEQFNQKIYYLLILIETLQILWFIIHPSLGYIGKPLFINFIYKGLSYLNFEDYMRNQPQLGNTFIIISFIIVIIIVITIFLSINTSISQNSALKIVDKIVASEILLLNTALTIPLITISSIMIYCDKSSLYHTNRQCFKTPHIIYFIMSIAIVVVVILSNLFYWFFFINRNPFSRSVFGWPNNLWQLGRTVIKIILPVYFAFDTAQQYKFVVMFAFAIIFGGYIFFLRLLSLHSFKQSHFYVLYTMQVFLAWFSINNILMFYLSVQDDGLQLIETIFIGILLSYLLNLIQKTAYRDQFLENLRETKVKKQNIEKFLYCLIGMLQSQNKDDRNQLLLAVKLMNSRSETCDITVARLLKGEQLSAVAQLKTYNYFLRNATNSFIEQYPSLLILKIAKCHILYKDQQKILALHKLIQLYGQKLSLSDEFMLEMFKAENIGFSDNYDLQQKNNLILKYYKFNQIKTEFQLYIQQCSLNNKQYWDQITQDNPSLVKIRSLAASYIYYLELIQSKFNQIMKIFPNNLRSIILYKQFFLYVGIDSKQLLKIRQKLKAQSYNNSLDSKNDTQKLIKFQANQNLAVMVIETVESEIGVIRNCNSQVKYLIGFQKQELLGVKVNKIMPKIISEIHDKIIIKYMETESSSQSPSEKTVYSLNKDGFLVKLALLVKIIPHSTRAFQLVGFFKQIKQLGKEPAYAIISLKKYTVEGVNKQFVKIINQPIDFSINKKSPILLQSFMPQHKLNQHILPETVIQTNLTLAINSNMNIEQINQISKYNRSVQMIVHEVKYIQDQSMAFIQLIEKTSSLINLNKSIQYVSKDGIGSLQTLNKTQEGRESKNEIGQQLPIEKKLQDYIIKHLQRKQFSVMRILIILLVILIIISSSVLIILSGQFKNKISDIFVFSNSTLSLASSEASISLLSQKIFDSNNQTVIDQFETNKNILKIQVESMKTTTINLIKAANKQQFLVEFNEQNFYNFVFLPQTKLTPTLGSSQLYSDGLFQFMVNAKNMATKYTLSNLKADQSSDETNKYIQVNGRQILPVITMNTFQKIKILFNQTINKHIQIEKFVMVGKSIILILTFLSIMLTFCNLRSFNTRIIQLYNTILLWDVNQLKQECISFIQKNYIMRRKSRQNQIRQKEEAAQKQVRNSSLLNLFPKKFIANIIDRSKQITNGDINYDLQQEKLLQNSSNIINESQAKCDNVNLKEIGNSNIKILIFMIGFGILIVMAVSGYYLYIKPFEANIINSHRNIQLLGKLRKNILFITYFAYQQIKTQKDQQIYANLLKKQLVQIYDNTKMFYEVVGDPNPTLKNIYSTVEQLRIIVSNPTSRPRSPSFIKADKAIQRQNIKLNQISISILEKQQNELLKDFYSTYTIRIIIDILAVILITKLIYSYYLLPLREDVKSSVNMIRMIPGWLIRKNKLLKIQIME